MPVPTDPFNGYAFERVLEQTSPCPGSTSLQELIAEPKAMSHLMSLGYELSCESRGHPWFSEEMGLSCRPALPTKDKCFLTNMAA